VGTYSTLLKETSSSACLPCPPDTFGEEKGADVREKCTRCPIGTVAPEGSKDKSACEARGNRSWMNALPTAGVFAAGVVIIGGFALFYYSTYAKRKTVGMAGAGQTSDMPYGPPPMPHGVTRQTTNERNMGIGVASATVESDFTGQPEIVSVA